MACENDTGIVPLFIFAFLYVGLFFLVVVLLFWYTGKKLNG